ncbi:MAG: cold shock domain-containing protein [Parachlamydiales bacterium]|jgi:CspA family cold shock protein
MFRQGTVKWYDKDKGYGFILEDGTEKNEIFFHRSNLVDVDQVIDKGQRVEFDVKKGKKGLEATQVKAL